jgi:hypothetical protein
MWAWIVRGAKYVAGNKVARQLAIWAVSRLIDKAQKKVDSIAKAAGHADAGEMWINVAAEAQGADKADQQ